MKKIILMCIALLFVFTSANAQQFGFHFPRGKWWQMPKVSKEIGLNEKDIKQLDALFTENRRKSIDLTSEIKKEKLELEQLFNQNELDTEKCQLHFEKYQNAQSKLSKENFNYHLDIRKILGSERYQKLQNHYYQYRMQRRDKGVRRVIPDSGKTEKK